MDIHRCRFIPYNPQAINALAFSHPPSVGLSGKGVSTLRLAVGRANGDIEIWNPMRGAWFQETILHGGKDRSIEGLAWTLDQPEEGPDGQKLAGRLRLFSIGYSTTVTEWDLEQGRPKRHSSGSYGEMWCLAAQPRWQPTKGRDMKPLPPAQGEFTGQHLAAGCADGSIVILSTADDDLKFLKTLRPSTKRPRVLSVTFQDRNTIVAGYADSSIRVFDIRSGQLLRTISLGKGPTGGSKELLVWSVKCLPDGTVVSGDSAGEVRFWDAKNYSLIQRLQGHLADTLDVAVSADGETVLSGGADQRTVVYRKTVGEKGDKSSRWAEVTHRRYHTHDVKTFAVYETKNLSIVVSGGPDASPVVLPLREFGKEHHRNLPSLPQIPPVVSAPSSRLVMSYWDREVNIWRVSRGPTSLHEVPDGQRHRLVGKVMIQGEENITSATLSNDGKILVVATISSVKVFSVRRRKGDERGTLRVQKLDAPDTLSEDGARLVTLSPDSRWLSIVRPNSDICLARVKPAPSPTEKTEILPKLVNLSRAPRHTRFENISHGTLGTYERTVRCVVFSHNSRILASGDLSGCIDTWSLDEATEATTKKTNTTAESDDESSDDDDEEDYPIIEGERWRAVASDSPIPRLKASVALLSFRPPSPNATQQSLLTNGSSNTTTTNTGESRLVALTTEHQLVEFDALEGKLSEWSRRNPKAFLPADFKGVKDRAMGCFWDLSDATRERLWLYGTSWLWMFDLKHDFPSIEELAEVATQEDPTTANGTPKKKQSHKRKRENTEDGEGKRGSKANKKSNTGAGDRISLAESTVFFDQKARDFVGPDASTGEWVSLEKERPVDEEGEDDEYNENNDIRLAQLRRADGTDDTSGSSGGKPKPNGTPSKQIVKSSDAQSAPPRRWWFTYKYRGILGIVPLSSSASSSTDTGLDLDLAGESVEDATASNGIEVAVVERPMWDVDLSDRYVREYE
ncbi:WD40-repeat-containing domain protein [Aspergillus keveii]|uniref:WD40-repeat-containing domain protein n=1 Tax=Aspergillus keveii TaxID=714993 RepID=A0ABR4G9A5_9EURO